MKLRYAKQLSHNKRIKVIEAVSLICLRYEAVETCTSINMPPRYGKSDVIRLTSLELNAITGLPSIMMAPWSDNVDQIKEKDKIEAMYERYGIPSEVVFKGKRRSKQLKTHEWWHTEDGTPTLITCTIGLIQNSASQQQFLDGIADMYQRSRRRAIVFIDEAHLIKNAQEWGKFIRKVIEAGGYIILLTGTPVPGLLGFKEDADQWIDAVRTIPRRQYVDGEWKHYLETYEGKKRTIRNITADLNVTWKEAWDIGALAKVNAVWVDVEVIDDDTGESFGMLSTLPKEELNGRLKAIEESEEMIAKKADAGVDRLLQLRSREQTKLAQMLVVTGSDRQGEGSNVHARAYHEAIKKSLLLRGRDLRDLRIAIATGVDNEGNPNFASAESIKAFRRGEIDILIVKLMGIVGLDVPACKTLVFGSTLRNGPMAIQALSRVLTTWECRANMILSNDAAMVELYDRLVKDQGGDVTESDLHLVHTEEIEAPPPKPLWAFQGAKVGQYRDEGGGITVGDFELELRVIKAKYHTNGLSDRQIIENYQGGGFPFSDADRERDAQARKQEAASGIRDLDEGLAEKEGTFGSEANLIVNKYIDYGHDPKLWRKKVAELQGVAKRICGVSHMKVTAIDDRTLLQRLINALPEAELMVFGHGRETRHSA